VRPQRGARRQSTCYAGRRRPSTWASSAGHRSTNTREVLGVIGTQGDATMAARGAPKQCRAPPPWSTSFKVVQQPILYTRMPPGRGTRCLRRPRGGERWPGRVGPSSPREDLRDLVGGGLVDQSHRPALRSVHEEQLLPSLPGLFTSWLQPITTAVVPLITSNTYAAAAASTKAAASGRDGRRSQRSRRAGRGHSSGSGSGEQRRGLWQ
jgi:hypothetical protein